MLNIILVFFAQFSLVLLLGLQQLNVQHGFKILSAITSFCLGVAGFYITATIAEVGKAGLWTEQGLAYLVAGPIAIICAISSYPKIKKRFYE